MAARKRGTKRIQRRRSNISSANAFRLLSNVMKETGKVPNFDLFTGKELTSSDRIALINDRFMKG